LIESAQLNFTTFSWAFYFPVNVQINKIFVLVFFLSESGFSDLQDLQDSKPVNYQE